MKKWFWRGAFVAVVGTFPITAVCAFAYRFPIPFVGYRGGVDAVMPALIGLFFYGLMGGILVQMTIGGAAGIIAVKMRPEPSSATVHWCDGLAICGASISVIWLAIADHVIGRW